MGVIQVHNKVIMIGQTLEANPHYKGKIGRVLEDVGDDYFNVFWDGTNTSIVEGNDLQVVPDIVFIHVK